MPLPQFKESIDHCVEQSLFAKATQNCWKAIAECINVTWRYPRPDPVSHGGQRPYTVWDSLARARVAQEDFQAGVTCSIREPVPNPEQDILRIVVFIFKLVQEANVGLRRADNELILPLVRHLKANAKNPKCKQFLDFLMEKLLLCQRYEMSGSFKVPQKVYGKQKLIESLQAYDNLIDEPKWIENDHSWFREETAMLAAVFLYEKHAILTAILDQLPSPDKQGRRDRQVMQGIAPHISSFQKYCKYCWNLECAPGIMFSDVFNLPTGLMVHNDDPPPYVEQESLPKRFMASKKK